MVKICFVGWRRSPHPSQVTNGPCKPLRKPATSWQRDPGSGSELVACATLETLMLHQTGEQCTNQQQYMVALFVALFPGSPQSGNSGLERPRSPSISCSILWCCLFVLKNGWLQAVINRWTSEQMFLLLLNQWGLKAVWGRRNGDAIVF